MSVDIKDRLRNFHPIDIAGQYALFSRDIFDITSPAYYVMPEFDDGIQEWGPARWEPRLKMISLDVSESPESSHIVSVATIVLPLRGDECFVARDNRRQPWILCWWPR